jgi:hypothetical protein
LRFGRHVSGSGGLFGFVEAAAGRRVALAQAAIWIVSYALYLVYTTVQIVYDIAARRNSRRASLPIAAGRPHPGGTRGGDGRRPPL